MEPFLIWLLSLFGLSLLLAMIGGSLHGMGVMRTQEIGLDDHEANIYFIIARLLKGVAIALGSISAALLFLWLVVSFADGDVNDESTTGFLTPSTGTEFRIISKE
ncbi:MAG TPA: hypothetical protein PKK36_09825 [Kiritimatiellia bacterium]|nr:hypothetical protein [Kiritimatiellia bacterium]